ncbi:MAG: hypothetical protein ABI599_09145 [Flavobacteriales bacterium]
MHIPLHVLEQKIASARKHLPKLFDKLRLTAGHYRRSMDKSPDKTVQQHKEDWQHGNGGMWLGRIRVSEFHTRLYGILTWMDSAHGVEALQFNEEGKALYFGPHFWQQYGERHHVGREHRYVQAEYFRHNAHITLFKPGGYRKGKPKMDGMTEHGLMLGHSEAEHIVSCNTFVDKTDLRPDKKELYYRLISRHYMRDLSDELKLDLRKSFAENLAALDELIKAA